MVLLYNIVFPRWFKFQIFYKIPMATMWFSHNKNAVTFRFLMRKKKIKWNLILARPSNCEWFLVVATWGSFHFTNGSRLEHLWNVSVNRQIFCDSEQRNIGTRGWKVRHPWYRSMNVCRSIVVDCWVTDDFSFSSLTFGVKSETDISGEIILWWLDVCGDDFIVPVEMTGSKPVGIAGWYVDASENVWIPVTEEWRLMEKIYMYLTLF